MEKSLCASCGKPFTPRPQTPHQKYCPQPKCQSRRRQLWQQAKLKLDPDYRENQSRAQAAWSVKHPDYWQKYRARKAEYAERNRSMQRMRNKQRTIPRIAKKDVSKPVSAIEPGLYLMRLIETPEIAKRDSWIVEVIPLSTDSAMKAMRDHLQRDD